MYIHPVIQHILERRGKMVPANDGRSIALVHFGGMMTGVRGAGALMALDELGLAHAFDDIYATSAAFPNASFFLAGNIHQASKIYYEDLCSQKFINLERVWDVVDIDYVLDIFRNKKKLDYEAVSKSPTRLHARLLNLDNGKTGYKLVNGLPPEEIEKVMHAAISIPYLDPGSIEIEGEKYKDAGEADMQADAVVKEILGSQATDILILYNYQEQHELLKKAGLAPSDRIYEIVPYKEDRLSRICTDPEVLKKAADSMSSMVRDIFKSS